MAAKRLTELRKWRDNPFTFRLSPIAIENRMKPGGVAPAKESVPCTSCGSVIVLGGDRLRNYKSNGKAFCDIQCVGDYKRWHNLSECYQEVAGIKQARIEKKKQQAEKDKLNWTCCDWCWNAFKKPIAGSKFCSDQCRSNNQALKQKLSYVPKEKVDIGRCCKECGCRLIGFATSKKKFCSLRCCKKSKKRTRKHILRSAGFGSEIALDWLIKKFKNRCAMCGCKCTKPDGFSLPTEATVDHIIPLSKGGLHIPSNVQLMCRKCNCAVKSDAITNGQQLLLPL